LSALRLHTNYINYPYGTDLANNASMPLFGLLSAPVTAALGPVASLNLLFRLAFATSSGAMFLVLRLWCRRWYVAFLGGLLYGLSPYLVTKGQGDGALDLAFVALPPLIVWCTYALVVERRRRALRLGALLGLLAGAQALVEPEVLIDLSVVLLVGLSGLVVVKRRQLRASARYLLTGAASAGVVFLVITADLLWWAQFVKGHLRGPVLPAYDYQLFRSDLLSPIFPTHLQAVAPPGLAATAARFVDGNTSEQVGYLGLPLVCITLGLVVAWRRNVAVRSSAALALVAFVLSLGSRLTIDGHVTSLSLPEAVLGHLPLLDNVVPARFALEVVLFVTITVAIGAEATLDWARSNPGRGGRAVTAGVVGLGALTLVSLAPALPFSTGVLPWPSSVESLLATVPPGGVVLTYPYPVPAEDEAMVWQAEDGMGFRLVGGYVTVQHSAHAGLQIPSLLRPASVQEFLVQTELGGLSYWPIVSGSSTSDLCEFIRRYGVTAVLYSPGGQNPEAALTYFERALGPPAEEQGVRLWFTDLSGCHTPNRGPAG
jgi:hypothetical protein